MGVLAEPYCRICACQVRPAQVKNCSNEECPLRVRPLTFPSGPSGPTGIPGVTGREGMAGVRIEDYGPAGPEYVDLAPKRPFDDGMAEFAREVQKLLARARKAHAEAFAAMLRIAAEEIDPQKDRGD